MSLSRTAATLMGVGALGLAVVGVGAGATFTDAIDTHQTITAGTMELTAYSPDIPGCTDASNQCHSITLPAIGPVGSTFLTNNTVITLKNTGNIPVSSAKFSMTEAHPGNAASNALASEMSVCIRSTDSSGGPWTEGNGPLAAAVALGVVQNPVTLAPGATMTYSVDFYAGRDSLCHSVHSDGTNTRAAWDGYLGGGYTTPASLTNDAQGGTVTPTLTFSFTG